METKKLKAFCAVAEHLSYTKAADAIFENYGTVRKWLISLEKELKTHLFNISDKKFVLTESGEQFLPHAQKIIESVENEIACFEDKSKEVEGDFIIATTNSIANFWIINYVKEFIKDNPLLNVKIKASDGDLSLVHREADVAITVKAFNREDVKQILINTFHMNLYASEEYIKNKGMPKTIKDLKNHDIISYGSDIPYPYEQINWHLDYLPEDKNPHICINSGAGVLKFIEEGMGIGSISKEGAQSSKINLIKILPDALQGPDINLFLRFPKTRANSIKIKMFYEYIKKSIGGDI